jgi:hypothetical protein
MSYIDKDATLTAIANKAKEELADVNHYFLEGVQLAVDVVEGMPDVPDKEKISDALYHIYRNKGTSTAAEGVAAIRYYIAEIWREIYGEEGPIWLKK